MGIPLIYKDSSMRTHWLNISSRTSIWLRRGGHLWRKIRLKLDNLFQDSSKSVKTKEKFACRIANYIWTPFFIQKHHGLALKCVLLGIQSLIRNLHSTRLKRVLGETDRHKHTYTQTDIITCRLNPKIINSRPKKNLVHP